METASAAQIAGLFHIPFVGIRVLSNNIVNGGTYDAKTGEACQDFVYEVMKAYMGTTLKRQAGPGTESPQLVLPRLSALVQPLLRRV